MSVRVIYPVAQRESIGADVNITTTTTYCSFITGYNLPVTLSAGTRDGMMKKICNTSGVQVQVNSNTALDGAASDQILINNDSFIILMYINSEGTSERYRYIDSSLSGITLQ